MCVCSDSVIVIVNDIARNIQILLIPFADKDVIFRGVVNSPKSKKRAS